MGSTWGASPTFCISRCFGRLRFFIEGNLPYIIPKMSFSKNNKMLAHVGFRMKITMTDSRTFVGIFKAFDKHMNVILSDCEEFRRVRGKKGKEEKEEKRSMGLVLLRGETIVTMTLEGPPPSEDGPRVHLSGSSPGPGVGRPAGRGTPGGRDSMQGPV